MCVFLRNHAGVFRPLRGGIFILNPQNSAEPGTLGCIATSDGTDRWIISCYHVLVRSDLTTALIPNEPVCQPADPQNEVVATVQRGDPALDCAAALIDQAVASTGAILGLPPICNVPVDPVVGMHVIKSGMATGVTEGQIEAVSDETVWINLLPGFPAFSNGQAGYALSNPGDSGALWLDAKTLQPVALNRGTIAGHCVAIAIKPVLQSLQLSIVP